MARQLVVELVSEAAKFKKGLDDAATSTNTFGDKVAGAGKKMTAFVSVPIAGFLVAGTKAAVDDAAAQDKLAKTLSNTIGNSKALVTQVEDYIAKAQKVSTFTDDELRPAFETFAVTTKSLEDSQRLMGVAMDVAAAKGIPLEQAALAVAKAHEGQFGAVNKLVPGLVDLADKSLTGEQAVAQLASTFNGQAIAATETTAGKMKNLNRDLGETAEKIGTALLPAISSLAGFMTNTLMPALDRVSGGNGALVLMGVAAAGPVLTNVHKLITAIQAMNLSLDATAVKAAAALGAIGLVISGIQTIKNTEGGIFEKILGPSGVSRFLDNLNPLGRQAGGPVAGGQPYIVGEEGPELFVPAGSGSIVPAGGGRSGQSAGGGDLHIHAGLIVTENQLADVIQKALLRKQSRTGSLGFR